MKPLAFFGVLLGLFSLSNATRAVELEKLKVLYVGDPPTSVRAKQFTTFLQKNVGSIEAVSRKGFQPNQAGPFDVVLLDWPQSGDAEWKQKGPLGERAAWSKPTVLLGSAGLNLAVVWKVRGGSG